MPKPKIVTARELSQAWRVIWRLTLRHPRLLRYFWGTALECARHNPAGLRAVIVLTAMYLHLGPFARQVTDHITQMIVALDNGEWQAPPLVPATEPQPQTGRSEAAAALTA